MTQTPHRADSAKGLRLVVGCDDAGLTPTIAAEVGNMLTNLLMVAAGVGVSVVPASMRGIQASLVAYVPLRGAAKLVAPLTVVYRKVETNPVVGRFISLGRKLRESSADSACEFSDCRSRSSQRAKSGAGDNVTKVFSREFSWEISCTTCLIKKLPNDTSARPRWQLEIE